MPSTAFGLCCHSLGVSFFVPPPCFAWTDGPAPHPQIWSGFPRKSLQSLGLKFPISHHFPHTASSIEIFDHQEEEIQGHLWTPDPLRNGDTWNKQVKSNRWNPLKKQGHLKQTGEISWTRYPSAYKKLCSDSIHGSISRAWSQIPTAHNKYTAENLKTTLSPKSKEISPNCNEIPLYVYIYICIYIYIYICLCVYIYIYKCIYIYIYICIYVYIYIYLCLCCIVCVHTRYVCIHVYIYIYTHLCTYTCSIHMYNINMYICTCIGANTLWPFHMWIPVAVDFCSLWNDPSRIHRGNGWKWKVKHYPEYRFMMIHENMENIWKNMDYLHEKTSRFSVDFP